MIFKQGVILIWAGTNASIPTGWTRETGLDGVFPKGTANATNPDVTNTGGNATHTHTSPQHNHTMANHVHAIQVSATTASPTSNNAGAGTGHAQNKHTHTSFNSGNPSSVTVGQTALSYGSMSNNPPYYEVIYIKPSADTDTLPNSVIYLADTTYTIPTGHYACGGANSTPNLANIYPRGAGTSGNAGGTGGATANTHDISHAHTVSHQHASATSGNATLGGVATSAHEASVAYAHTHAITLNADTTATGTTSLSLTPSEVVEPAYTKLLAVQKQSGSVSLGMIAMWGGTLANIPSGWILCDGSATTVDMRSRYLKLTATQSEAGNTGGANSHTHASQNHAHTNIAHTHGIPQQTHTATSTVGDGSTYYGEPATAVHATATSGSANYSLDNAGTTADSSSNEPSYRTVAFIKLVSTGSTGSPMLLKML